LSLSGVGIDLGVNRLLAMVTDRSRGVHVVVAG
jgi:hypothetical protein